MICPKCGTLIPNPKNLIDAIGQLLQGSTLNPKDAAQIKEWVTWSTKP